MTGKKTAVFFALLAAALYAVNIPLSKLLEESGAVTPAMLAGLLYCGAGVGMAAVFCGVTNCPISTLLISFELFGLEGMLYYLIAVSVSYMASGYYGLYHDQKIIYSKSRTEYINRKTK